MGKVRITMRFYRAHDLDLITFIEEHEFNVQRAIYCALTSFSNGELFMIEIPPRRENAAGQANRVFTKVLTLDEELDKKAIQILQKIKDGKKNNFLKNLLRLYLCNPMSEDFLINPDDSEFFYKCFQIFRVGKRTARAGHTGKGAPSKKAIRDSLSANTDINSQDYKPNNPVKKRELCSENTSSSLENDEVTPAKKETKDSRSQDYVTEDLSSQEEDITDMFLTMLG